MPPKNKGKRVLAADELSSPPAKKRSRTSRPSGEYDKDPGRASSQSFLAWGDFEKNSRAAEKKKSQEHMEKFKKDMAAAKEEALAQLSEAWQKMTDEKEALRTRVTKILSDSGATSPDGINRLQKLGTDIVQHTRSILGKIEKADKIPQPKACQEQDKDWAHDRAVVQEAVKYGGQFGAGLVGSLVHPNQGVGGLFDAGRNRDKTSEAGRIAMDMFEASDARKGEKTWGQTYGAQYRALLGLMDATICGK